MPALPPTPPSWIHELPIRPGPPWVSMGVRALDLADWLVFDEHTPRELAHKRELAAARPADVFLAEPGSEAAGLEVRDLVTAWLARHRAGADLEAGGSSEGSSEGSSGSFPARFHDEDGDEDEDEDEDDRDRHPLEVAARRVPEDLCVMVERDGAYVLAAAAVSFPSHWRIADKMGADLTAIHRPVHHYASDLARKVDTFFARLTPQRPVVRRNVSVHDHDELFRPEPPERYDDLDVQLDDLWLRSERQTLLRLPGSGAVLFTIKTQQCPVAELAGAPQIARGLAAKYRALLAELDRQGDAAPVPRWLPDALERLGDDAGPPVVREAGPAGPTSS